MEARDALAEFVNDPINFDQFDQKAERGHHKLDACAAECQRWRGKAYGNCVLFPQPCNGWFKRSGPISNLIKQVGARLEDARNRRGIGQGRDELIHDAGGVPRKSNRNTEACVVEMASPRKRAEKSRQLRATLLNIRDNDADMIERHIRAVSYLCRHGSPGRLYRNHADGNRKRMLARGIQAVVSRWRKSRPFNFETARLHERNGLFRRAK